MKISANFTLSELACRCGNCEPVVDKVFIERLQELRNAFAKPMTVTSWFRCKEYNAKIKGATSSLHVLGRAVDIAMKNSADRFDLVHLAIAFGFKGIGIYSGWIHIDNRDGTPHMWVG